MTCNLITNAFLLHSVRRVRLRWNRSDLEDISEFKQLMDAVDKYEILAHLKLGEEGIEHLAEITPKNGDMGAIKQIPTFEIREIHEEDGGTFLTSVNLTHTLPMMMLDLEKIQLHPPYGLDSDGLELNFTGKTDSMKRLLDLLKLMMPWDSISVQSVRKNHGDVWRDILTDRQIEVLRTAFLMGYYSDGKNVKIKDIAENMGMARSTMGGHLKLIEHVIMSKVVDDIG